MPRSIDAILVRRSAPRIQGKSQVVGMPRTHGGVYLFADAPSREDYLNSDIVRSMRANPVFTNITMREFGTFGEATNVTGGPLATELEMLRR